MISQQNTPHNYQSSKFSQLLIPHITATRVKKATCTIYINSNWPLDPLPAVVHAQLLCKFTTYPFHLERETLISCYPPQHVFMVSPHCPWSGVFLRIHWQVRAQVILVWVFLIHIAIQVYQACISKVLILDVQSNRSCYVMFKFNLMLSKLRYCGWRNVPVARITLTQFE